MDALELAALIAEPIQVVGMSFYFDEGTRARGKARGLRATEYYGLGRAGTMGEVSAERVHEVFAFFSPSAVDFFWTRARAKADPVETAADYLLAAYDFADANFAGLDHELLGRFALGARSTGESLEPGRCPLVDGYLAYEAPSSPVHGAYLGAIVLRELRGALHAEALRDVGLDHVTATYVEDPTLFELHGFVEDQVPAVSDEDRARKVRAESLTNDYVARCLAVLSDAERDVIAEGALAMFDTLQRGTIEKPPR